MAKYDVVIIGAGVNGLLAGAYLSKAGLKVLLVEKRYEAGGGLATEEVTWPGFLSNTHAVYMMMVDYAPAYNDFEIERKYDVRHVYPSLQVAMPLADGRSLCLYSDVEKTCRSIAQFSQKDAAAYAEMSANFGRFVAEFLAPATYVPPVPAIEQAVKLELTELGRDLSAYSEKSPQAIVDGLFENEHVRTLMLYLACHWGLPYDVEGVGYLVPLYINRAVNTRMVVGGSHRISQAFTKVILENGGAMMTTTLVKRIIVDGGSARGIELTDGTVIEANRAVVSSLDPHQTFLKLVGEKILGQEFAEKIRGWIWEDWSLFQVDVALEESPNFLAARGNPDVNNALMYVLGYESVDELIHHFDAMAAGQVVEGAGFNLCFPTLHDPTQAPPGQHVGVISQMAAYNLKEGADRWWKVRKTLPEKLLATLRRYAPNVTDDKLMGTVYATSPLDIENKFNNMVQGSIKQGKYHPLQMGFLRPNEDCSDGRTPVKNLYLCGACIHPGGLVLLGSGYLAAGAVADDLGVARWWTEPAYVQEARANGLL
ncbi:MAG: NAD(P)/FAD-dependent oxidoreductase [Chloroflexi bacterium]|nr:NAD(P)/FAD-dependent oxidoreductase [Chloroflexota bacterium]